MTNRPWRHVSFALGILCFWKSAHFTEATVIGLITVYYHWCQTWEHQKVICPHQINIPYEWHCFCQAQVRTSVLKILPLLGFLPKNDMVIFVAIKRQKGISTTVSLYRHSHFAMVRILRPRRPLTAPFSTNIQIRQFLGSLQRLSHDINGSEQSSEHITIWPHPIGFAKGTKRLNWIKDFPYLAEYSYFAECFRKKAPGRMWAGLFVAAIESWVGKKVLAEWHVWAAIIISPEAPATGKKLLIYDCDGEDVDFGHCRAREALPLSIQHDFWRQKKMPFTELWRSIYNPETFGQNQCMKNTCEFLIHTVTSPPRITVGPDGEEVIDGFRRVLCL
ncbi:hypothetical protein B0H14DRAFT_3137176 [Mycena olivaceomarginata]|nr:hypothetical protein B0H14DRAFT_3137176 [Mycena olivaceomarginata]